MGASFKTEPIYSTSLRARAHGALLHSRPFAGRERT